MSEKKLSLILGTSIFVIVAIIYIITLEPSASYWDCSEFITCAYKLEVGHAPGAPLFMLLGRFFSLFAGGNTANVAYMVNMLSAIASALTCMFLFWTIVWFARKIQLQTNNESSVYSKIGIYGSGVLGALTYAVTDSAWFSAVEGEVYATSSFFTAVVFWAITKWEEAEEENAGRWIILIFYLLGLSVGVHLLNILALPAVAIVYFFKKYKYSHKGLMITFLVSFLLIVFLIFGLIPGVAKIAAYTDMFFVNSLSLPVYSGALFIIATLIAFILFAIRYFRNKKRQMATLFITALAVWLTGYSSFAVLVIRSKANPYVNINNVENLFGLVDYLNREQYPKRPIIYGNNYNSPILDYKKRYTYKLYNGKYHKDELNPKYIFDKKTLSLFPRMASLESEHPELYQSWIDIKGRKESIRNRKGKRETIKVPTLGDNIHFFIRYQLGHMYLRYFMWNFSGRQNDIQGLGSKVHGNWITGIPFIDKIRIGEQPEELNTNIQKTRNVYFMIPFILGLIGLIYQFRKNRSNFWVVLFLFILSGAAIVVYLNEVPRTPRERDYAYVGSYYAFAIWIGLSLMAITNWLVSVRKNKIFIWCSVALVALLCPVNMLFQNFDDHNRSGRTLARDFGQNVLSTCDKNAILFTVGDNDTYPLWYNQEVEEFRTDVRHVLLTFLPIEWYAHQIGEHHGEKGKVPLSFNGEDMLMGDNQYVPVLNKFDTAIDLKDAIAVIKSDDPVSKVRAGNGVMYDFLPGNKLKLKLNKSNFVKSCSYFNSKEDEIPDEITFSITKKGLNRDDLLLLDMLAQNDWERPLYFVYPHLLDNIGLGAYLHREGNIYRFMPWKNKLPSELNKAQALYQYKLVIESYKWGNLSEAFLDYFNRNVVSSFRYRQMFTQLALQLSSCGEREKAIEILDMCNEVLPGKAVPYDIFSPKIAEAYYVLGDKEKGDQFTEQILDSFNQKMSFYSNTTAKNNKTGFDADIGRTMYVYREFIMMLNNQSNEVYKKYSSDFKRYFDTFYGKG